MAIVRKSIWINTNNQPTATNISPSWLNTIQGFTGNPGQFGIPSAGNFAGMEFTAQATKLILDTNLGDNTTLRLLLISDFNDSSVTIDGTVVTVSVSRPTNYNSATDPARELYEQFNTLLTDNQFTEYPGGNVRRISTLTTATITSTAGDTEDTFTFTNTDPNLKYSGRALTQNDVLNPIHQSKGQVQAGTQARGLRIAVYTTEFDPGTITSEFAGGSYHTNTGFVPLPNWSASIPNNSIDPTTGRILNINDLYEVYTIFDDTQNYEFLRFNGLNVGGEAYLAGEVFTDQFLAAIKKVIAPQVLVGVTSSQQTLANKAQLIKLIFNRDDGTSLETDITIPPAIVDVTDYNLTVTPKPIDISIVEDQTVINIENISQTLEISSPTTTVNFAGTDTVDISVFPIVEDVLIKTPTTDVVFQHQGFQGPSGIGFAQIFFRTLGQNPGQPFGGNFDFNTNVLTPPTGWFIKPPGGIGNVYTSFSTITVNANLNWSVPVNITSSGGGSGGGGTGTSFRVAQPITPPTGLIWARRFTYSQNLRIGNTDTATWLEIVPGLGDVTLTANGTDTERNNYLILDANTTLERSTLDFINSNNEGRK